MRFVETLLAFVLMSITIGQSSGAISQVANTSSPAQIVWFSDKESQGLRQDSAGNLIVSSRKLDVENPVAKLFAAAYYPNTGTLVTVDGNAVTRLYEKTDKLLKLKQTRPPHETKGPYQKRGHIRPISVRFCNIPGLVYLTWSYPEPRLPWQMSSSFSERLALGSRARGWHAVTSEDPNVRFLKQTYQIASGRTLHLFMPDGKRIIVRLPGQLAETMGTNLPYVETEPVFVLPGRAIICKTRNGWSMHNFNGNLISYFPCGSLGNWGWHEPFYHNGQYYAVQMSKGARYYRMDISTGKLIYVGEHPPQ